MRKAAGLKRGSRKQKQQSEDAKSPSNSEGGSVASSSTNGERRKPSNEEAALTSKNYRLAKELSELRVRHRDETKNVTRLTMENMNLASRCREAISHVAMLKKELVMHQKRASEALAVQRQQSQRSASNHSEPGVLTELSDLAKPSGNNAPSSTDVAVEMDRMDKLMASHAPPPPPPAAAQKDDSDSNDSPRRENEDSPTSSSQSSSEEQNGSQSNENTPTPSIFPHTASPKPKHRVNYNDDYPGDVAPHKASHGSSLPSVQDEDDESSEAQTTAPLPVVTSHAREVANMKLSSIDAFEASFDTAFPSSFIASPKEGDPPATSEIYNPFFSSPQKKGGTRSSPMNNRDAAAETGDGGTSPSKGGRKWGGSVRDRSPAMRSPTNRASTSENPNETMPKMSSSVKQPTLENTDEDRARVDRYEPISPERDTESSSRMPDPSSSPKIVSRASTSSYGTSEQYRTPPHFQPKVETEKPVVDQPKRPEKTITASARARYEKALQPRGYHSRIKDPSASSIQVDTSLDSSTEQARNSPGTVLRRLQQRRAKSDRFQQNMEANSNNPIPGIDSRRSSRPLRHPPILPVGPESPFDEGTGRNADSRGSGRSATSQNGSYRSSQNESENTYQRSRSETTNPAAKKQLSPDSMNAEIRALDAMAGSYQKPGDESPTGSELSHNSGSSSSSSRYAALKQRRSVKQPISYAEPSLNTKLRRGDVYFERTRSEDSDSIHNAVSPTGSSPEDVSGARRASRTRVAGASPDEVLKDLGAAVRS